MDYSPKFVKFLGRGDVGCNEMFLPSGFCHKYGDSIPSTVKLIIRNGYEIWLDFDRVKEKFLGMSELFKDFSVRGGQSLVFEHLGGFDFNVCIVGVDGCEIEYPYIVHNQQTCTPREVSFVVGGCSFVHLMKCGNKAVDDVDLPLSFIDRVGSVIPGRVEYVVTGGLRVVGSYSSTVPYLSGLACLCNMLEVHNLNFFNVLVLTFDGAQSFTVTAFDGAMSEIPLYPKPRVWSSIPPNTTAFEIVIQPCHMLPYCYGVDIPAEFRDVGVFWYKTDYITAYKENMCWGLKIKKRADWKRMTIHTGWITFRDDLKLETGDLCVFEWKNDRSRNFNIRIVKKFAAAV